MKKEYIEPTIKSVTIHTHLMTATSFPLKMIREDELASEDFEIL